MQMSIKKMMSMLLLEVAIITSLVLMVICGANGYTFYVERLAILMIVLSIIGFGLLLYEIAKAIFEEF